MTHNHVQTPWMQVRPVTMMNYHSDYTNLWQEEDYLE